MKGIIILLSIITILTQSLAREPFSIDAQIESIKNAAPEERVKLMNQFKRRLSVMNASERTSAIKGMQAKMQKNKDLAPRISPPLHIPNHAIQMQKRSAMGASQGQSLTQQRIGPQQTSANHKNNLNRINKNR